MENLVNQTLVNLKEISLLIYFHAKLESRNPGLFAKYSLYICKLIEENKISIDPNLQVEDEEQVEILESENEFEEANNQSSVKWLVLICHSFNKLQI